MVGKYFEELNIGDKFESHGRTVTEADLSRFCCMTWNADPGHNDREWVRKNTDFKDRLFPGLFIMALAIGLDVQTGVFSERGIALLGFDQVRFTSPLYPNDTIKAEFEIVGKRETSKPDRGIITIKYTVRNQDEAVIAEFLRTMLWRRRPNRQNWR